MFNCLQVQALRPLNIFCKFFDVNMVGVWLVERCNNMNNSLFAFIFNINRQILICLYHYYSIVVT